MTGLENRQSKFILYAAICWIASFLWILFLSQGLQRGDLDEWALLFIAEDSTWRELFGNLITPWCKSHFWFNQIDGFDQIHYKRILNGISLKFVADYFGLGTLPNYLICKALFFATTLAVFFRMLLELTKSVFFSLIAFLFFALVPAHYTHALWLSDPATLAQTFIILGMWFFYQTVLRVEGGESWKRFWPVFGMLFLVCWLGIKTKETALIVPMVMTCFIFSRVTNWWPNRGKAIVIGFMCALLALQIIPIEHLNAVRQPFSYDFSSIGRILFRNFDVGYDNEATSAFTSLEHFFPVSIARTLGFWLLWTIVLFFVLYWILKLVRKKESVPFLTHPLITICVIWLAIDIALMGRFQPEVRFFSTTMIPLTLLIVRLFYCVSVSFQKPWRFLVLALPLFAWGWSTFYTNTEHVIWLRLRIGQRGHQFYNAGKFIYQDQFPEKPDDPREIAHFYIQDFLFKDRAGNPHIKDYIYFTELEYQDWNKTSSGSVRDYPAYAKKGALYYITSDRNKLTAIPEAKLVHTIDNINHDSLFEKLLFSVKKKRPYPLYIFKYVVPKVS